MPFIRLCCALYDSIHSAWGRFSIIRKTAMFAAIAFVCSGMAIWANKMALLPAGLAVWVPTNYYASIQIVFTMVLLVEMVELIFALADSVALAVRKQLEIMSLILLRDVFKAISQLNGPLHLEEHSMVLLQVGSVALGGYILFIIRGLFLKMHYVQQYTAMEQYLAVKKCVALALLVAFVGIGIYNSYTVVFRAVPSNFFHHFYTTLIFADILIILVGQYFLPSFHITFRNSGYAVSTLIMRVALEAPYHISAALCVLAGCYILLIAWGTARFSE